MSLASTLNVVIVWTAASTVSFVFVTANAQQKPFAIEDAISLARPLTDQDPSVHSVEILAQIPLKGTMVRLHYWYEAPEHYEGLMADDVAKVTFFAAVDNRAILYDPRKRKLLVFTDIVPGIRGIMQNGGLDLIYNYARKGRDSTVSSGPLDSGVFIDLPAMLASPNVMSRELQASGGGKYRLILTSKTGSSTAVTIDPSHLLPTRTLSSEHTKESTLSSCTSIARLLRPFHGSPARAYFARLLVCRRRHCPRICPEWVEC